MNKKIIILTSLIISLSSIAVLLYSKDGQKIGTIKEINSASREILVSLESGSAPVKMGDRIYVRINEKPVIMKSTFPMMTVTKCKLEEDYQKLITQLKPGMQVFMYEKGVTDSAGETNIEVTPGKIVKFGKAEMVYIKGGEFVMGSSDSEMDRNADEYQHKVKISDFWMGRHEVTIELYREIMKDKFNEDAFTDENGDAVKVNEKMPVTYVGWNEAVEFCNRLSKIHGLKPCYTIATTEDSTDVYGIDTSITCDFKANGFRLPTEAEWEYACRAGTVTPFSTGENITKEMAYFDREYTENANVVGLFKPNGFGLYDMHGNVAEFCWDWYKEDYYTMSPLENPTGPDAPDEYSYKVFRGGSMTDSSAEIRSAARPSWFPEGLDGGGNGDVGFRLCRSGKK